MLNWDRRGIGRLEASQKEEKKVRSDKKRMEIIEFFGGRKRRNTLTSGA